MSFIPLFLFFGSIWSITVEDSFVIESDPNGEWDDNFVALTPHEGFGFGKDGHFELQLNIALILFTSNYHKENGMTIMCTYPVEYRQNVYSGETIIKKSFSGIHQYALLLAKCEMGTEMSNGSIGVSYKLVLKNTGNIELSVEKAPLVVVYAVFMGLLTIVFIAWLILNLFALKYCIVLNQVPLTFSFMVEICYLLCKFLFYYYYSTEGVKPFWVHFLMNLMEVCSKMMLYVALFIVVVGWGSFQNLRKVPRHHFMTFVFIVVLLLLFFVTKSVWIIPDEIMPLFTSTWYVFQIMVQFGILIGCVVARLRLQKFQQSNLKLVHQQIYYYYTFLGWFFWGYAAYVSLPVFFSIIYFAILGWNQLYIYDALMEFNNLWLYILIVICFRAMPYKWYKSVLDNKKST